MKIATKGKEEKVKFQRVGGSFLFKDRDEKKRRIKPGQIFSAYPSDLSQGQLLRCVRLDGKGPKVPATAEKTNPPSRKKSDKYKQKHEVENLGPEQTPATHSYEIKEKGGNWFDIVDENGKVINEKSLRKKDAEEMLKALQEV
jgi:hypothetical protein